MSVAPYGIAYLIAAVEERLPLWLLFLAAQLLDAVWAVLVLLGIERARLASPPASAASVDFTYMPYSHSLAAALAWSGIAWVAYRAYHRYSSESRGPAFWLASSVLCNWCVALVVHRRDLPLQDNLNKMGFGLWDHPLIALFLTCLLLLAGYLAYRRRVGVSGMTFVTALLMLFQAALLWTPLPSIRLTAAALLIAYFGFAGLAYGLRR